MSQDNVAQPQPRFDIAYLRVICFVNLFCEFIL